MYQSVRQHTADARKHLGDEVLAAFPATRWRGFALLSMHALRPKLLVFFPDRVDAHANRAMGTGPGVRLSTTAMTDVRFRRSAKGQPELVLDDDVWRIGNWHEAELQTVLSMLGLDRPETP